MTLKMALLAPMLSASVSTMTAVKPATFARLRNAYRKSCPKFSMYCTRRISRHSSCTCATPPSLRSAPMRAS